MTSELKVINSVLKNKDIGTIFEANVDNLFTSYGDVWTFIKKYYSDHRSVPPIELVQENFPGQVDSVNVVGATDYYVDGLREEYMRNMLNKIVKAGSQNIYNMKPDILLKELMGNLYTLADRSGTARDLDVMDFDSAEKHYENVRRLVAERGGTPGIPTGVSFVDSAYPSGLAPGDLVIMLGWTGRAKSYFSTYVACNAFQFGYHPMIISLEMDEHKVKDRVYTLLGNGQFRNSELAMGEIETDNFRSFAQKHNGGQFTVVANNGGAEVTPNLVQAKINQHKPDIVILDYAQLMSDNSDSGDMVGRMRNLSKELKSMAVANKIPIILISSATPDNAKAAEVPPTIEQVAWSKQLAFDADLAFAVHKHDNANRVEIVGRKNRNGDLFRGILDWDIDRGIVKEMFDDDELEEGFSCTITSRPFT